MNFSLLPRFKPNYDWRDTLSALNIFKPNAITRFESEFAQQFENEYGVMFAHGRTGLFALLKLWKLENTEIICPAYTCVVVPDAIVLSGCIPVFVDCEKNGVNMDIDKIKQAITENTRCIVVTHLFGYPMNVVAVEQVIREAEQKYGHKIYIIQDCAHSYGCQWQGKLVTQFGDASIFGCNVSKLINTIFGGMVITNNIELKNKLHQWRGENCIKGGLTKSFKRFAYFLAVNLVFNRWIYKWVNVLESMGAIDKFTKYYQDGVIRFPVDWNTQPCAIEARVGLSQLAKYNDILNHRRLLVKSLTSSLSKLGYPFITEDRGATYSHLVSWVDKRDETIERFNDNGVQLGFVIEYSIPQMTAFKKYSRAETPNSDYNSRHIINFPICDVKVDEIIDKLECKL